MALLGIAELQGSRYTTGMGTALSGYIRTLREYHGWEPADVTARLSEREGKPVDPTWLWRLEKKGIWPKNQRIITLLEILGATLADVVWTQANPEATEEQGQERAEQLLSKPERDWLTQLADTDPKRAALLRRVYELSSDPELRGDINGYLNRMEGER